MIGRWWSPTQQVGETSYYSGPFIQWNVEGAWDRRAAAVSRSCLPLCFSILFCDSCFIFLRSSMFLITMVLRLAPINFVLMFVECFHSNIQMVCGRCRCG